MFEFPNSKENNFYTLFEILYFKINALISVFILRGKFWKLKATLFFIIAAMIVSLPYYFTNATNYQYVDFKINHPFFPSHFDQSLNLAKRDFRLLPPLIGYILGINSIGLVVITNLLNCGFLYLTLNLFYRIIKKKSTAFYFSLAITFTYLGISGFNDILCLHFDMFAYFLVLCAMNIFSPFAIIFLFLSYFVDERALLSGVFVIIFQHYTKKNTHNTSFLFWGYLISIVAYFVSRYFLTECFGLYTPLGNAAGVGGKVVLTNIISFRGILGTFLSFEFLWIIIIIGLLQLKNIQYNKLEILLIFSILIASIFSAFMVLDITRSISYLFPIIFLMVYNLNKNSSQSELIFFSFGIMILNLLIGSYSVKDIIDPLITSPSNIKVVVNWLVNLF